MVGSWQLVVDVLFSCSECLILIDGTKTNRVTPYRSFCRNASTTNAHKYAKQFGVQKEKADYADSDGSNRQDDV